MSSTAAAESTSEGASAANASAWLSRACQNASKLYDRCLFLVGTLLTLLWEGYLTSVWRSRTERRSDKLSPEFMLLDVASDFSSDMRRDSILPLRFATWRARPVDAGCIPAMDKEPAREVSPGVEIEKAFPLAISAAAVAPASTERDLAIIFC